MDIPQREGAQVPKVHLRASWCSGAPNQCFAYLVRVVDLSTVMSWLHTDSLCSVEPFSVEEARSESQKVHRRRYLADQGADLVAQVCETNIADVVLVERPRHRGTKGMAPIYKDEGTTPSPGPKTATRPGPKTSPV